MLQGGVGKANKLMLKSLSKASFYVKYIRLVKHSPS